MDVRTRTRKLVPMVGGITAAATAVGGLAAVAQVAPVSAEPGGVSVPGGVTGLAGPGMFESCDAYFGFGKDEGVLGVVAFDVADVNGADGVDHAVPDDVEVVLVLENEEGDVLECVPFEVTEDQWEDGFEGEIPPPPFPGPGRYAYPSVNLGPFLEDEDPETDDFGLVTEVGFRVTTIPGQHTLVSPEGVKEELRDIYLNPDDLAFEGLVDPRVIDAIEAGVDAAAAAAYEDGIACPEGFDDTDPDVLAGFNFLLELLQFEEEGDATEVSCNDLSLLQAFASLRLGAIESASYVEDIRLRVPEPAPTPTPTPTAPPGGAAQPVTASPTFTG